MANYTKQETLPLHIENTVNSLMAQDLKLPQSFKTYRYMLEDEYIGGGVSLIQSLCNKTNYYIKPKKSASAEEKKLATKLNESLSNMKGMGKSDFLNYILSELSYGHSMFEFVFKRDNGSFVFDSFSPIHPMDVNRYEYKRNSLAKLILNPSENDGLIQQTEAKQTEISGDKVLMFRLNPDLDNPLGKSILNRCYKAYKTKQIVSEYELIGVAKNMSGVLKISAPSEYINDYYNNPQSVNAQYLEELVAQAEMIHAGKSSLAVVASDLNPNGVRLFDVSTIGNEQGTTINTDVIIKRLNNSILTTLYTDILSLGQGGGGSFALSDSKTTLLALFIDSIFKGISNSFSKVIKVAYELNNIKSNNVNLELVFDSVESLDWEAFTRGWQRLAQSNIVTPDNELEDWIREAAKAPERDDSTKRVVEKAKTTGVEDQNDRDEKEA